MVSGDAAQRTSSSSGRGSGGANSPGLAVRTVALSRMFLRHLPATAVFFSAGLLHSLPVLHQPWSHSYQLGAYLLPAEPSSVFFG